MPFVPIDDAIAFAIDAALKSSDIRQMDQNIDDHESRIGIPNDGSVTNAKINGGHLSFNMVETSFTWTSYQDIGKGWYLFIPNGVTKISVQFRAKNSVNGANVRARLRIGSTYGVEGYITSDTNYEILNLDITPASGDKNTYVQMVVQTYVSSGTGYMHHSTASSDNSGNVDYSSAATFIDV